MMASKAVKHSCSSRTSPCGLSCCAVPISVEPEQHHGIGKRISVKVKIAAAYEDFAIGLQGSTKCSGAYTSKIIVVNTLIAKATIDSVRCLAPSRKG